MRSWESAPWNRILLRTRPQCCSVFEFSVFKTGEINSCVCKLPSLWYMLIAALTNDVLHTIKTCTHS